MGLKTINIDGHLIGKGCKPFVIAELSANHNGSIQRAFDTIDAAAECGASAIKLQTYTADTMTIDCKNEEFYIRGGLWDGLTLYDLYKQAETPYEWHAALFDYAKKKGITCFSTPFDETAVDLLESLNTPAYKVASFEMTDLPLVSYIAKTKKPMIISTGMSSEAEIAETLETAKISGCEDIVLLHCISSYPTPISQANLLQIQSLAEKFDVIVGLSDHTLGTVASITAVALGAAVIEKHFTLNRKDQGPDSAFSIEPREFKTLCDDALAAWQSLGKKGILRQESEKSNKLFRRSIYFVKDLKAGDVVKVSDIKCIRPSKGLEPKYFSEIVGKVLWKDVKFGTPTSWTVFED